MASHTFQLFSVYGWIKLFLKFLNIIASDHQGKLSTDLWLKQNWKSYEKLKFLRFSRFLRFLDFWDFWDFWDFRDFEIFEIFEILRFLRFWDFRDFWDFWDFRDFWDFWVAHVFWVAHNFLTLRFAHFIYHERPPFWGHAPQDTLFLIYLWERKKNPAGLVNKNIYIFYVGNECVFVCIKCRYYYILMLTNMLFIRQICIFSLFYYNYSYYI